jgi:hypothetical protein
LLGFSDEEFLAALVMASSGAFFNKLLVGLAQYYGNQVASLAESVVVSAEPANGNRARAPAPPPPRPVRPQKITVSATVQAAFQIQ